MVEDWFNDLVKRRSRGDTGNTYPPVRSLSIDSGAYDFILNGSVDFHPGLLDKSLGTLVEGAMVASLDLLNIRRGKKCVTVTHAQPPLKV
jgi:hypothetical protein